MKIFFLTIDVNSFEYRKLPLTDLQNDHRAFGILRRVPWVFERESLRYLKYAMLCEEVAYKLRRTHGAIQYQFETTSSTS